MNFEYETDRLILKILDSSYAPSILKFLKKNKEEFEPFEALKSSSFYTIEHQTDIVQAEYNAFLSLKYIRYYAFPKNSPDTIIGTISFYNILPPPYCCCTTGYKIDRDYQHKGYGREMVRFAVNKMFTDFGIHRIEAYVMDNNIRSARLLESVGFSNEGLAHKIIKVGKTYKDHYHFAIIAPD